MLKARELLDKFSKERNAEWIPDDLAPLFSHPRRSEEVTDLYLADLAAKHDAKLATLDQNLTHKATVLIP